MIGIARDTDVGADLLGEPRPVVYLPLAQGYDPFLAIVCSRDGDVSIAVRALREAIRRPTRIAAIEVIGTGRTVLSALRDVFLRPAGRRRWPSAV